MRKCWNSKIKACVNSKTTYWVACMHLKHNSTRSKLQWFLMVSMLDVDLTPRDQTRGLSNWTSRNMHDVTIHWEIQYSFKANAQIENTTAHLLSIVIRTI